MARKSVAEQFQIKPNTTLWLSHAGDLHQIEPLPAGVQLLSGPEGAMTAVIFWDSGSWAGVMAQLHGCAITLLLEDQGCRGCRGLLHGLASAGKECL